MTRSRDHESNRLVIVHDTEVLEESGGLGRQVEEFNVRSFEFSADCLPRFSARLANLSLRGAASVNRRVRHSPIIRKKAFEPTRMGTDGD
jgi:hypothetical protein